MDGVSSLRPTMSTNPMLGRAPSAREAPEVVGKAFEELFTTLVLKQMRQTLDSGGLFAGDESDVLGGLFDHYMGQHLAKSGGFGIGAMIRRQMELQQQAARTRPT